jgi:hypothetical protein
MGKNPRIVEFLPKVNIKLSRCLTKLQALKTILYITKGNAMKRHGAVGVWLNTFFILVPAGG